MGGEEKIDGIDYAALTDGQDGEGQEAQNHQYIKKCGCYDLKC